MSLSSKESSSFTVSGAGATDLKQNYLDDKFKKASNRSGAITMKAPSAADNLEKVK